MPLNKLISAITFSLFSLAQEHTICSVGATFRGKTSENLTTVLKEVGVQAPAYYAFVLIDSRSQLKALLNHNRSNADIDINSDLVSFLTDSQRFFGSLGMRFYFDQRSRRYLPRLGHSAPFLGAHFGGRVSSNDDNIDTKTRGREDLALPVNTGYRFYINQN